MKILIVDDENLARQRLIRLLTKIEPEAELREAENGSNALSMLEDYAADVVLLDIRMPVMDGVAVAARLMAQRNPPAVIFCTAYDEYALQALQQQATGYLLKPVRENELARALRGAARLNRVQLDALVQVNDDSAPEVARTVRPESAEGFSSRKPAGDAPNLLVSAGHTSVQTLELDQVRCLLAEDKYVRACAPDAQLLLSNSLKELEDLHAPRFVRVHRNALVALAHVRSLSRRSGSWCVELEGVSMTPTVSRRHLASVKSAIKTRVRISGPEAE